MKNSQETPINAEFCTKYQGAKVVVLGASGFIGRWVARALCECGAKVYLVVRDRTSAEAIFKQYGVTGSIVEMDLTAGAEEFVELFQKINPAITFNLAGYGVDRKERDETLSQQINTELVRTLCGVISKVQDQSWTGQHLVHIGSALEYGITDGDLSEDSLPAPTTSYGQTKLAGTRLLSEYNERSHLNGMTARLFTVYGPGEHDGRLLPALIGIASNGQSLDLTAGLQERDFTYVSDVAEGLLRIGSTASTNTSIVNLATGHMLAVREFSEIAATSLSIPAEKLNYGAIPTREEEMQHAPVAVKRFKQLTGWLPQTDVKQGVRKTVEFLQSHG